MIAATIPSMLTKVCSLISPSGLIQHSSAAPAILPLCGWNIAVIRACREKDPVRSWLFGFGEIFKPVVHCPTCCYRRLDGIFIITAAEDMRREDSEGRP